MAKIEQLEPRIHFREQWLGAPDSIWRRHAMPAIRWGSVTAGVAVSMSVQLVLALFGLAAGLALFDTDGSGAIGMGPLIWSGASLLAASFVGGFVAARMSGLRRKTDGVLHGAVFWAVSTLIFAALSGYAGGIFPGGVFNSMAPETVRDAQVDDYSLTILLRGMIGGDASVSDVSTLQRYLQTGQREEATLLLTAMGMDPVQVATVMDRAMILVSGRQAGPDTNIAAAGVALKTASAESWMVFGSVLLSLLLGMAGGLVGALGSQRLVWSKSGAAGSKGAETVSS